MDNELKVLISNFKSLKTLELQSMQYYTEKIVPIMKNDEDRKKIEGIALDEEQHAKMVQTIIDILERE